MDKLASDSTKRKRLGRATLDAGSTSMAFLQAIFDHGPTGFAFLDTDLRFVHVNDSMARINGRSVDEHLGKTPLEILGPQVWEPRRPILERALAGEMMVDVTLVAPLSTPERPLSIVGSYVPVSSAGSVVGVAVIIRDTTDFANAQSMLTRQSLAFENLFDALVITDGDGIILDCNNSFLRRTGLPRESLISQSVLMLVRSEDRETLLPSIFGRLRLEGRFTGEIHYVNIDGEVRLAEVSAVPLRDDGGAFIGLVAAIRDITERKRADEALRRSEELYRRTSEDLAAAYERERSIAGQLQSSLHPNLPRHIAGLSIANYYRPALEEAEVGGDFVDCFPLHGASVALAVGDLSGKGLAAAVQVATVRNMLRFAIYNGDSLSESVARLNSTLWQFDLVTGFATLFAASYDGHSRVLDYVNCGQEPALVYRVADGIVEELSTTGPILGSFENFNLEQRRTTLSSGDVLAVFTDGMTEVGARGSEFLGALGVGEIMRSHAQVDATAGSLVERIVEEVTRRAGGRLRDDACLLVAVVD